MKEVAIEVIKFARDEPFTFLWTVFWIGFFSACIVGAIF